MAMRRIQNISKLSKTLLAEGESERVDFKRSPDGISADDLVGFANSPSGGSILVGVDEHDGSNGAQIGVVRGCDVSDPTILQITNKALSCVPPFAIKIFIENLGVMPFLRIDIPSSGTKPHCTPKGTYCLRDGNRNRPLHPTELLNIFLESESRAFAEKFEAAANRISFDLSTLESSLDRSIKSMADQLGWADYKLDDTESALDSILAYTQKVNNEASDISTRLRALFRQDKREDPIREKARKELLEEVVGQLTEDKGLFEKLSGGGSVGATVQGKPAVELNAEEVKSIFREALKIVAKQAEDEKSPASHPSE